MAMTAAVRRAGRRRLTSTTSVATDAPVVALTFDDGPDPRLTGAVLDTLARRGAPATFFVVAERARRHPDLLRRVVSGGHEIGLHGDRHVDHCELTFGEQLRALHRGRRTVEGVAGRPVRWFRPPYGRQEPETVVASRLNRMSCVLWSASAHDWEDKSIEAQLAQLRRGLRPGAIVLLHDGSARPAIPPPPPPRNQPELLDRVLDVLTERGLRPVTLSDLYAGGQLVREQWFERWLHH